MMYLQVLLLLVKLQIVQYEGMDGVNNLLDSRQLFNDVESNRLPYEEWAAYVYSRVRVKSSA
jgi:hypothetical protein